MSPWTLSWAAANARVMGTPHPAARGIAAPTAIHADRVQSMTSTLRSLRKTLANLRTRTPRHRRSATNPMGGR
eukprot:2212626-Lingulodinium_polyedra.AAC.1